MKTTLETLQNILELFKNADDERFKETVKAREEAEKWLAEGDRHGWNFFQGMAGGITWGSLYFGIVRRKLEEEINKHSESAPLDS